MRIRSAEGAGTSVDIVLPRYVGSLRADAAAPTLDAVPRAEAGQAILVVEMLQELGYDAIEAMDGPSGLRLLRSAARIDRVVSDVGLPGGMNGRQMADAGREPRPDLKVLFVTGYAENAVLQPGDLDFGMHVLGKPFTMDMLASRIRELLRSE